MTEDEEAEALAVEVLNHWAAGERAYDYDTFWAQTGNMPWEHYDAYVQWVNAHEEFIMGFDVEGALKVRILQIFNEEV